MSRKMDAKTFAQQKQRRRQWLTFVRMVRYGINNFSRNAWLTIAATAVMTITLLIVFTTLAARNLLMDTVDQVQSKVDMSMYVKTDTPQEAVDTIADDLRGLSTVVEVKYVSPDEGRKTLAERNSDDIDTLNALNVGANKIPGVFKITLKDINDTDELSKFAKDNATYTQYEEREPSFAGKKKEIIENIARGVGFAEKLGILASIVFSGISALIVFNTIRMAIFSRKEEIQMMKLIGADRSFIRGPFVVEATVYGFIAAVLATSIGVGLLFGIRDKLESYGIAVQHTIDFVTAYIGFVLVGMILLGATIGIVSSLLATRKYLKLS